MKRALISVVLLVALPPLSAPLARQTPSSKDTGAEVQILVYMNDAQKTRPVFLSAPSVWKFQDIRNDGPNLAEKFHDGRADKIPFGEYVVWAGFSAFSNELRVVQVSQKKVTVVVGANIGELPTWDYSISGRVLGRLPTGTKSFVRLLGVFSNASRESTIGSDGTFELSFVIDGDYLLMVVDDAGILASKRITQPPHGPLEIDLVKDSVLPR
jgi:hypothetical protein